MHKRGIIKRNADDCSTFIWKSCTPSNIPRYAVKGGRDGDGSDMYVGKALHNGDWLPAKVVPRRNEAYVAHGGQEHVKSNIQVLCEQKFDWVKSSNGQILHNAVPGGATSGGETLYIGRVNHAGTVTIGKVHPSHRCCYISYGGKELSFTQYEILIVLD